MQETPEQEEIMSRRETGKGRKLNSKYIPDQTHIREEKVEDSQENGDRRVVTFKEIYLSTRKYRRLSRQVRSQRMRMMR